MKVKVFLYGSVWSEYGIPVYRDQPAGTRVATEEDFIKNGQIQVGKWFLLKNYHSGFYEAYKIKEDHSNDRVQPWLNDNRIFVHI